MNKQILSTSWAQTNNEENILHSGALLQNSNMNIKTESQDNIDIDEDSMNALENELMQDNEMWSNFDTFQDGADEQYYAYDGVGINNQNGPYDHLVDNLVHPSEKVKRKRKGRKSMTRLSSVELVSVY